MSYESFTVSTRALCRNISYGSLSINHLWKTYLLCSRHPAGIMQIVSFYGCITCIPPFYLVVNPWVLLDAISRLYNIHVREFVTTFQAWVDFILPYIEDCVFRRTCFWTSFGAVKPRCTVSPERVRIRWWILSLAFGQYILRFQCDFVLWIPEDIYSSLIEPTPLGVLTNTGKIRV